MDSAVGLSTVLERVTRPTLFWLDAHIDHPDRDASGNNLQSAELSTANHCPLLIEVRTILEHQRRHALRHAILIDDARMLRVGTSPALRYSSWPTVGQLQALVCEHDPMLILDIRDDIARIYHEP